MEHLQGRQILMFSNALWPIRLQHLLQLWFNDILEFCKISVYVQAAFILALIYFRYYFPLYVMYMYVTCYMYMYM